MGRVADVQSMLDETAALKLTVDFLKYGYKQSFTENDMMGR